MVRSIKNYNYCHRGLGRWFATACDLGGYLFYFYCHRGLGRWFATARDFGWISLRLQILPSRLRPMVLQPPATWVETLLSDYCHCSLGRWFSVAAACSSIKFSSVLTLTVASYTDWDGYCFIDAVRALFSDPLITGPGSSALAWYCPIEDAISREGYPFATFTTFGRSGLSPS